MSGIARTFLQLGAYAIGYTIGGPFGAAIANTLFNVLVPVQSPNMSPTTRLSDLMRQGVEVGSPVKRFFGVMPTAGDIIEVGLDSEGKPAGITEVVSTHTEGGGTGGGGGQSVTDYTYYLTCGFLLGEGPLFVDQIVAQTQNEETVVYDRFNPENQENLPGTPEFASFWDLIRFAQSGYVAGKGIQLTPEYEDDEMIAELSETVRIYPGTERQKRDTALQTIHGDGPNYRGYAWVMFNMWGPISGNTTFKFFVRSPITGRKQIITKLMNDAGIPSTRINLTSIDGDVHGAAITQVEPPRNMIESIAGATLHDISFINGAFRDISRMKPATWTLKYGETGAYMINAGEENPESKSKIKVKHNKDLPSSLTLRFLNKDNQYRQDEVISHRNTALHENPATIELPIADTFSNMMHLADIILDEMWASFGEESVTLLPDRDEVAQGNVIIYQDETGPRQIRVVTINRGTKGPIECQCVPYDPGIYGIHRLVSDIIAYRPTVLTYQAPLYFLQELPALNTDMLAGTGTNLIFAATTPSSLPWGSASIMSDPATAFGIQSTTIRTPMGSLVSTYTYDEEDLYRINWDQTIAVQMIGSGDFTSLDDEGKLRIGANLVAINNLLISYVTATPMGSGIYNLTGILPGRYGTDWIKTINSTGSRVIRITNSDGGVFPGIKVIPFDISRIGRTLTYQVVSVADTDVTTGNKTIAIVGNSVKPPRPSIDKRDDGTGGYWVRIYPRTRDPRTDVSYWDTGIGYILTDPAKFTVILRNGSTIVNQRTVTLVEPFDIHYTHAELLSYFSGSVPATLSGSVFHEGTYIRGHERIFTI